MYTLNLTPQLADGIKLSAAEMETLRDIKGRADSYLQAHPNVNADPSVLQCIKDNQAREAERQRAQSELFARFKWFTNCLVSPYEYVSAGVWP